MLKRLRKWWGRPQAPESPAQSTAPQGDDGFLTSMVIGAATNSTAMGALLGGNLLGGAVGDALVSDAPSLPDPPDFDGGGSTFGSE